MKAQNLKYEPNNKLYEYQLNVTDWHVCFKPTRGEKVQTIEKPFCLLINVQK